MTIFTSVAFPKSFGRQLFLILTAFFVCTQLQAQAPKISIQGTLKSANGTSVDDGTYNVTFKLYRNPMGGSALWQEDASVDVIGSIYSHYLGSITPLNAADFDSTVYLGVVVGNFELTPRTELSYSPYAFSVTAAQTVVCSGAVGDVKYSVLNPTQFAAENGACWVPMDGRALATTDRLRVVTGWTNVPNAGGLFFRSQEYGSSDYDKSRTTGSPIAQVQTEAIQAHNHPVSDPGHDHPFSDIRHGNAGQKCGCAGQSEAASSGTTTPANTTSSSNTGISVQNAGGPETRPVNMNLYAYIRIN